jgi:hypothetical protein
MPTFNEISVFDVLRIRGIMFGKKCRYTGDWADSQHVLCLGSSYSALFNAKISVNSL